MKSPKKQYEAVLIGSQIRHLRRIKDMSQTALAQKVGVSLGWIGRVERGIHLPHLTLLFRIAKVTLTRFWGVEEEKYGKLNRGGFNGQICGSII